jgi:hypothetical protein
MRVKLWLSDHAWDSLAREAHALGWIRAVNTVNIPGLSTRYIARFFDALSVLEYQDTRPEQFEGTCVWQEGERTFKRHVSLEPQPLSLLAGIATRYRIPPRWYASLVFNERAIATLDTAQYAAIIANEHTTVPGLASAALEAIGVKYLTPPLYPAAPRGLFRNRQRTGNQREQRIAYRLGFG